MYYEYISIILGQLLMIKLLHKSADAILSKILKIKYFLNFKGFTWRTIRRKNFKSFIKACFIREVNFTLDTWAQLNFNMFLLRWDWKNEKKQFHSIYLEVMCYILYWIPIPLERLSFRDSLWHFHIKLLSNVTLIYLTSFTYFSSFSLGFKIVFWILFFWDVVNIMNIVLPMFNFSLLVVSKPLLYCFEIFKIYSSQVYFFHALTTG